MTEGASPGDLSYVESFGPGRGFVPARASQARASRLYVPHFYAPRGSQPYLVFWFTGPAPPLRFRERGYTFAADETGRA